VGAFTEHDAVELLDGVVVEKMSENPAHRLATRKCDRLLSRLCPAGWHLQNQEPITLQNSEPEPDVAIIRERLEDYADRHPLFHEVRLVVEVSETTLVTDRYKTELYAQAQIPVYWLINLVDGRVEVMTNPQSANDKFIYAECKHFKPGHALHLIVEGQKIGVVPASELLG
jgi:Uma2 family endonuclease